MTSESAIQASNHYTTGLLMKKVVLLWKINLNLRNESHQPIGLDSFIPVVSITNIARKPQPLSQQE